MVVIGGKLNLFVSLLGVFVVCFTPISCKQDGYAVKGALLIGEVGQRDRSKPVYEIQLPALGEREASGQALQDEDVAEVMSIVTALGQRMQCKLPKLTGKGGEGLKNEAEEEAKTVEETFEDLEEIMAGYEGKCWRLKGIRGEWWVFEFCYGKYFKQFHKAKDENEESSEFILGKLDRQADLERRKNLSLVSRPDAVFTQVFGNGTICDLTGRPREITIKYKCLSDTPLSAGSRAIKEMSFINGFQEIETCVYEVDFFSGAICHHPLYKKNLDYNVHSIQCSMEEGAGPFQGLGGKDYAKSTFTL